MNGFRSGDPLTPDEIGAGGSLSLLRGVGSDKRGAAAQLEQINELMDAGDLELTHLRRRDTAENTTFFLSLPFAANNRREAVLWGGHV